MFGMLPLDTFLGCSKDSEVPCGKIVEISINYSTIDNFTNFNHLIVGLLMVQRGTILKR